MLNLNPSNEFHSQFEEAAQSPLDVNIAIGVPSDEQLALSGGLLDGLGREVFSPAEQINVTNYDEGRPEGILEARQLMGDLIDYPAEEVIVHGNSSLQLMWHYIRARCGERIDQLKARGIQPKMLVPVPGFYRHFKICKNLGIEVSPTTIFPEGPDYDLLEHQLLTEPGIIGMICVPKHSNPTGEIYTEQTVRMLSLLPVNDDQFTILWDNAYARHDFYADTPELASLRRMAEIHGAQDNIAVFGSTSKITLPGAGIAAVGLSPDNFTMFRDYLDEITIGPDKEPQLRHHRFFSETPLDEHMKLHTDIMRPKFEAILDSLDRNLGSLREDNDISWSRPKGGFFISLSVVPGTAKRVIELCAELGLTLTKAGACFPNGDERDYHIRIAPSAIHEEDLEKVGDTLSLCVRIATAEEEYNLSPEDRAHREQMRLYKQKLIDEYGRA